MPSKNKKVDLLSFDGLDVEVWVKQGHCGPYFEAVFPDGEKITNTDGEKLQEQIEAEVARRAEPLTWTRCIEVHLHTTRQVPLNIAGLCAKVLDLGARADGVLVMRTVTFLDSGKVMLGKPQRCRDWSIDVLPCWKRGDEAALLPYSEAALRELERIDAAYTALSQRVRGLLRDPAVVERLEAGGLLALEAGDPE